VPKLTISERRAHGFAKGDRDDGHMRYLAAAIGFVGTIVLLLPVH